MGQLTYLAVLGGCLVAVAWLEPALRLRVYRHRRRLLWTVLPVALLFGLWDVAALAAGHWWLDPAQTTGVRLGPLPLDEALFLLVIPVCAIYGYEAVAAVLARRRR
ncbi:lycopene cyclase [Pilimelia terevasa]|uniref:Lycopene cyclase n=1 Tax=Pilimelia terevasa TaxID=53372 RepID=A0A8J3FHJ6_9ACTN|nr:lycopene cyclase domain-containing protein [Pilimelia terevasa]GGK26244.1 lycopene cyclase [Pilimelia terevasa]